MSTIATGDSTESYTDSRFADPQLGEIAESAEIKPRQSRLTGILYELLSWFFIIPAGFLIHLIISFLLLLVFVSGLVLPIVFFSGGELSFFHYLFILVPLILLTLVSFHLTYRFTIKTFYRVRRWAKRLRASALSDLQTNDKPPILYLRSFSEDLDNNENRLIQSTYEEDLAVALSSIGPLVAIGQPGDEVSPLGATRIYVSDDDWQEKVQRLMEISQLVVIHAGTTDALMWEFEATLCELEPRKLIISVLSWADLDENRRADNYTKFKKKFEKVSRDLGLSITLPENVGEANFVVFDEDWTPRRVALTGWRKAFYRFSSSCTVTESLRPVLNVRGLSLSWWRNIGYGVFLLWMAIGILGIPIQILIYQQNPQLDPGIFSVGAEFMAMIGLIIGMPILLIRQVMPGAFDLGASPLAVAGPLVAGGILLLRLLIMLAWFMVLNRLIENLLGYFRQVTEGDGR